MRGFFQVSRHRSGPMSDHEVALAIKREGIDAVLRKMPRDVLCPRQHNQVSHALTAWLLDHVFQGPNPFWPLYNSGVGTGGLSNITLSYQTSEPVYNESATGSYWSIHEGSAPVNTSSSGKRFYDDDIEDHRIVIFGDAEEHNLDPKESILFRSRFLYLPSQGLTTEPNLISSIFYYYANDGDTPNDSDRASMGRVRLRDEAGRPIRISKSAEHVLLVEIELELTTV